MPVPTPHFLLFSTARSEEAAARSSPSRRGRRELGRGRWGFVLESVDGSERLEVAESESDVCGQRLELLSVIRGLEALDQPSRVTLVTNSDHVCRGLRFGIQQWRENGWQWEFFGRMVPVRNADLWQRLDRAVRIHDVRCRTWRWDVAEKPAPLHGPPRPVARVRTADGGSFVRRSWAVMRHWLNRLWAEPAAWLKQRRRVSLLCAE